MTELELPPYGTTQGALSLLCALLLAVACACLASCGPTVRYRRLPPPLEGDMRCPDPLAQCLTREGVCRERRRGACEGPNEGGGSASWTSSGGGGRRVAVPAPGLPL